MSFELVLTIAVYHLVMHDENEPNECNKERMIEEEFGSKRKVNPNEITKPISKDFVDWLKKVNQ